MLKIQNLTVAYGSHVALKDVSLDIAPGEILAVIGPNGAGKSTMIRAISGVLPIRSGRALVDKRPLHTLPDRERARLLAVVPQARQLPADFTVYETVMLGRTPYLGWLGKSGSRDREQVAWALDRTALTELAERKVGNLSGGEQQRVLLARALVQAAPVLLLDEPTTHLDLQHQSGLLNLMRSLAGEKDLAVLIVLHDLNLASLYADRVALLVNGRLHTVGAPIDVLTSHNLSTVYNVPVEVIPHPVYGTPLVLPDGVAGMARPLSAARQNGAAVYQQPMVPFA